MVDSVKAFDSQVIPQDIIDEMQGISDESKEKGSIVEMNVLKVLKE